MPNHHPQNYASTPVFITAYGCVKSMGHICAHDGLRNVINSLSLFTNNIDGDYFMSPYDLDFEPSNAGFRFNTWLAMDKRKNTLASFWMPASGRGFSYNFRTESDYLNPINKYPGGFRYCHVTGHDGSDYDMVAEIPLPETDPFFKNIGVA